MVSILLVACHEEKPRKMVSPEKMEEIKSPDTLKQATPVSEPGQDKNDILVKSDELPSYEGGYDKMLQDLEKRIHYPDAAREMHMEGRVIVAVDLDEQGHLSHPRVLESTDKLFENEALRVVGTIQSLHPAKKNGHPVAVEYHIPVIFRLK